MPESAHPHPAAYLQVGAAYGWMGVIQETLWRNRTELRDQHGLLYVREYPYEDFHTSLDLRRSVPELRDIPQVGGSWSRAARRIREWNGVSILSHGTLALLTRGDIRHALAMLDPVDVHVVFTTQSLVQQAYLQWQQNLHDREVRRFEDYLSAIDSDTPAGTAQAFFRTQDARRALGRWSEFIPPERIHIVTVPVSPDAGATAWERFAGLVGLPVEVWRPSGTQGTRLLSPGHAEFLRSVNAALPGSVGSDAYQTLLQALLPETPYGGETAVVRPPRALTVPQSIEERQQRLARAVIRAGYDVIGDLADLQSTHEGESGCSEVLMDEAVLDVGLHVSKALVENIRDAQNRIEALGQERAAQR